jgi:gliding motility-associated-like protein
VITDGNGCIVSDTSTITEPTELIITSSYDNVDCNGAATGSIDITATGGTGALSYNWSNGSNSEDLNNIPAGNYTVDVTDANGCQESEFFVINQPSPFSAADNVTHVVDTCNGAATGSIDITVTGGTGALSYNWSNGSNSEDLNNIPAGNYTVDVTDAKGCEITYSYLITEPDALLLDYTVKPASCEEKDDGAIYASATGGTLPISYDWSNGEEGQDILDLSKGVYSLQVEDANGCTLPLETIEVNFDGFDGCIEIPSGFTPNGDGIHDEWSIYGLYYFADVVVNVYNRWGQEMYSSKGYAIPWDGKYQGVDLPTATYYYVIQLTDSEKVFNGTVTIKR